ncbi:MAG: hypothetical protein R3228_13665 [Halioglobus sp.]|nr:hypothetical protein [Halioglobus sp.]
MNTQGLMISLIPSGTATWQVGDPILSACRGGARLCPVVAEPGVLDSRPGILQQGVWYGR